MALEAIPYKAIPRIAAPRERSIVLRTPTKMRFVFLAPMFCAQYVEMPEPSAIIGCITKDSSLEAAV